MKTVGYNRPLYVLPFTTNSLATDPKLSEFAGWVSDSGEGRWTVRAAIDEGVPVPVLSAALYERFASRREAIFQDKLLSTMRLAFGGHIAPPRSRSSTDQDAYQ